MAKYRWEADHSFRIPLVPREQGTLIRAWQLGGCAIASEEAVRLTHSNAVSDTGCMWNVFPVVQAQSQWEILFRFRTIPRGSQIVASGAQVRDGFAFWAVAEPSDGSGEAQPSLYGNNAPWNGLVVAFTVSQLGDVNVTVGISNGPSGETSLSLLPVSQRVSCTYSVGLLSTATAIHLTLDEKQRLQVLIGPADVEDHASLSSCGSVLHVTKLPTPLHLGFTAHSSEHVYDVDLESLAFFSTVDQPLANPTYACSEDDIHCGDALHPLDELEESDSLWGSSGTTSNLQVARQRMEAGLRSKGSNERDVESVVRQRVQQVRSRLERQLRMALENAKQSEQQLRQTELLLMRAEQQLLTWAQHYHRLRIALVMMVTVAAGTSLLLWQWRRRKGQRCQAPLGGHVYAKRSV